MKVKNVILKLLNVSPYKIYFFFSNFIKKVGQKGKINRLLNEVKTNKINKLQIGCGHNLLEGWINTDLNPINNNVIKLDASKAYPFQDATFDFIYSEHIFEHLTFEQSVEMLKECKRVLKPYGVMRIAIPHQDFLFNILSEPKKDLHHRYCLWSAQRYCKNVYDFFENGRMDEMHIYVVNNFYRDWGHQVIHSHKSLNSLLETIGFIDIQKKEIGDSEFSELRGIEKHGNIIPKEFNKLETLVLEFKK